MTERPMLRVGRIPFLNLLPIYRALETGFPLEYVRFVPGHPFELNRKLRAGKLDISPSSSIEYGKHPERYLLVPDVSISSRSKVMSVLLFSHRPAAELPGGPIAVTASSDTSVILLEILLREFLGKRNRLVRTSLPPRMRSAATRRTSPSETRRSGRVWPESRTTSRTSGSGGTGRRGRRSSSPSGSSPGTLSGNKKHPYSGSPERCSRRRRSPARRSGGGKAASRTRSGSPAISWRSTGKISPTTSRGRSRDSNGSSFSPRKSAGSRLLPPSDSSTSPDRPP